MEWLCVGVVTGSGRITQSIQASSFCGKYGAVGMLLFFYGDRTYGFGVFRKLNPWVKTWGLLNYGIRTALQKLPRYVSWIKQQEEQDYMCLNVDGSVISNQGMAGFGGVV